MTIPRIACLGWGSLVWNPAGLPIQKKWFKDGPIVRVEFLRESDNGCLTLVLHHSGPAVPSLWAIMDATEVPRAREDLRLRERCTTRNFDRDIRSWKRGDPTPALINDLGAWATARGIDAVIWTGLPPKSKKKNYAVPTLERAVEFLKGLTTEERKKAEEYIRKTPLQIDTPYRRRIEADFHWTPLAAD